MTSTVAAVEDPAAWSDTSCPGGTGTTGCCSWTGAPPPTATALPADPDTVIAFLDAHPAARATNRRRLTAIRWAHQHASTLRAAPDHATAVARPPTHRLSRGFGYPEFSLLAQVEPA